MTDPSPGRTGDPLVLRRRLAAPRALVFAAFTEERHLAHWMSPRGFTTTHCTVDLRAGGHFHYALATPDGATLWGRWTFREIVAPERLVVVVQFSDAEGGVTRNPWSPVWPLATLSTTTLADDPDAGGDGTLVTLRWQPLDATADEEAAFGAAHASMNEGWGGTFDHLETYLAQLRQLGA